MQRVNAPPKIATPWAALAAADFRRTVPTTSQIGKVNGAASWPDGFVPLNFTAVAAGGVPPFGKDMNGALYATTLWDQWYQAGGPIRYDPTFQATIKGYPAEARVGSNVTANLIWVSTVDNNLTNPDAGGAGWTTPTFTDPSVQGGTIIGAITLASNPVSNTRGVYLRFLGNGTVSPNKYIHVHDGNFVILNNNQGNEIFTLNDSGDLFNLRDLTANGTATLGGLIVNISGAGDAEIAGTTTTGDLVVTGDTHTGAITASGAITTTGALHAASATITGAITGASLAVTGDISGDTGTFDGALTAASGWFSGAVTADSASITHALTAGSATINTILHVAGTGGGTQVQVDGSQQINGTLHVLSFMQLSGALNLGGQDSSLYFTDSPNVDWGGSRGFIHRKFSANPNGNDPVNDVVTLGTWTNGGAVESATNVVTINVYGGLSTKGEIIVGNVSGAGGFLTDSVIRFSDAVGSHTGYIFRDNTRSLITISAANTPLVGVTVDGNGNFVATGTVHAANIIAMEAALAALTERLAVVEARV